MSTEARTAYATFSCGAPALSFPGTASYGSGEDMANPEHLARLIAGIDSWHHWRATSGVVSPDLSGADLSPNGVWQTALMTTSAARSTRTVISAQPGAGADLSGVDFSNTDLRNVNLGMANMTGANLCGARVGFALLARTRLDGANLTHAALHMTQLTRASAVAADFRYADLSFTVFAGADLQNARFADAVMAGCVLTDLDLRSADGLKFIYHTGPSSIGLDTVYRSGGLIPIEFLRCFALQIPGKAGAAFDAARH